MTSIEWCDRTWNPVVGCSAASPGCDHCYAAGVANRAMQPAHEGLTVVGENGPAFNGVVRCLPDRLDMPLKWRKPSRVFVNSMSDLFHPQVPDRFIAKVFATMARCPQHTFQILTKRPQRMSDLFEDRDACYLPLIEALDVPGEDEQDCDAIYHELWPLPNVWLGTSIESDRYAFRANHLRSTMAAVRFLSLEPLLGPLPSLDLTGIDWARWS